jgi:hypothetical protein
MQVAWETSKSSLSVLLEWQNRLSATYISENSRQSGSWAEGEFVLAKVAKQVDSKEEPRDDEEPNGRKIDSSRNESIEGSEGSEDRPSMVQVQDRGTSEGA